MAKKTKDYNQERFLLALYSQANRTPREESINEIRKFVEKCMKLDAQRKTVLDEAIRTILRMTEFKEIAISAKDIDGNFRFLAMSGFKKEAEAAMRAIVYTPADLMDHITFPAHRIGMVSEYCISEMNPYKPGEEATYNEPQLIGKPRSAPDDMMEGDYIDIYMDGPDKRHIGWIELSQTKTGKLPSRETIVWLELFVSCLSIILLNLPAGASA
ncbi:MAG: hypothetical protein OEV21_01215 [Thermoplasmata archaeon]|nr:hypothetical protein [Thermoplasmata archaeon]